MKRFNSLIKTTGYLILLLTMLTFTSSCENNSGSVYPDTSKFINRNSNNIYGEWTVVKARDNGFDLSLLTYAKNDSFGHQWLDSTLLKEDEYKDLKLLNDSRSKVQMVTTVFIKQDEFTDLEQGKEYDYTVQREAGTLALHGKITGAQGCGDFEFTPDQTFIDYFQKQGYEKPTVDKVLRLFIGDTNKANFNDLQNLFDHLPMDKLSDFNIHGVTLPFIKNIHDLGYKSISPDELVKFRIHKATPEFIREIQQEGYEDISPDELIKFRIHKVSLQFLRGIHEVGLKTISPDELIKFRIHKISPLFIREIHVVGIKNISPDELIDFKVHGVTPEFIREIQQAGIKDISPDKLIVFRIHGVTGQNEEYKTADKKYTSYINGKGMINNGSLINNEHGLQLSNSKREISMFSKEWKLTLSGMIHTDNIIELHFQSARYKGDAKFIVEPYIGYLPDSKDKTWDIMKRNYKNYKIRPESRENCEIDGLPSTTYIADYDKAGKKMIEYCTYFLNKQELGMFELHVENKYFNKTKPGFDSMIQSFKWKSK